MFLISILFERVVYTVFTMYKWSLHTHTGVVTVVLVLFVGLFQGIFAVPIFAEQKKDGCFITVEKSTSENVLGDALRACERNREKAVERIAIREKERVQVQNSIRMIDMAIRMLLSTVTPSNPAADMHATLADTDEQVLKRVEHNTVALKQITFEQNEEDEQWRSSLWQFIHYLDNLRNMVAYHHYQEITSQEKMHQYENTIVTLRRHLLGVRDANAISSEQALAYTEQASLATGVRPEFLLGLIKNESALGHNIGGGVYRTAMHPTRDQTVFPNITDVLGYNPDAVPVSANPGFGWGGAMGSAQFIPSTWVCYGGFVNAQTNTCEMTDPLIQSPKKLVVGSAGADVRRLQEFLNTNGFSIAKDGPGSPGNETETYTHAVAQAVIAFQEHYADRILEQYNRTRGTGSVGPATRNAINQIDFYAGPWRYVAERDIIRRLTHNTTPSDPWNPRDAFFASALYLRNLGAVSDECEAARRYYAGSNWESRIALNYCRAVVSNARAFEESVTIE